MKLLTIFAILLLPSLKILEFGIETETGEVYHGVVRHLKDDFS